MEATAERIDTADATRITGLSMRGLQAMAQRGEIPGAAKLGKKWTFNELQLRRWIAAQEAKCPISTGAVRFGGAVSNAPAANIDEAYERAIGLKRKRG